MANKARETLEKRAQRAMLQHALFRWESAIVISLTLLLMVFSSVTDVVPLQSWMWLVGGLVAELALVYSSLTDPETGKKVIAEMLHDEFHPERLSDRNLRQKVEEAFDYRSRITAAIRERRDSVLKDNLSETAGQIDEWVESMYGLAKRLDRYRQEKEILDRDRSRAGQRIRELKRELKDETDETVRKQMEGTIGAMDRQVQTIDSLEQTMERAQLQLESTLTALGTIYSQTMLVGAKDIDSGRARRLQQDIADEVQELDHVLLAMDEVYASSAQS